MAVNDFRGFPANTDERRKIAGLAWEMGREGFDGIEPEELEELITLHGEELTEEDLEAIIKVVKEEEEVERSKLTIAEVLKVPH